MFEKIKEFFGAGKHNVAALVREIVRGETDQSVLLEPENLPVLKAFVEYGHSFSAPYQVDFLKTADAKLVKTYLEMGFSMDDASKNAVLERKDDELAKVLIDSGSWSPFPYGGVMHPFHIKHQEQETEEEHDDLLFEQAQMRKVM